jgi:hypothetical protein
MDVMGLDFLDGATVSSSWLLYLMSSFCPVPSIGFLLSVETLFLPILFARGVLCCICSPQQWIGSPAQTVFSAVPLIFEQKRNSSLDQVIIC